MNRDRFVDVLTSKWHPLQREAFDRASPRTRIALLDALHREHEDSIDPHSSANDCADASSFEENPGTFASQIEVRKKVVEGEPWAVEDMFMTFTNSYGQELCLFDVGYFWESGGLLDHVAAACDMNVDDEHATDELHQFMDHFVA